jgi:hypothetical protein
MADGHLRHIAGALFERVCQESEESECEVTTMSPDETIKYQKNQDFFCHFVFSMYFCNNYILNLTDFDNNK